MNRLFALALVPSLAVAAPRVVLLTDPLDPDVLSAPLAARCTASTVDKGPRKLERPSDHAPVIAELSEP